MKTAKASLIIVAEESGENMDFCDENNNHRITVVRMESGHVGLRFSPLPPRDGYKYSPLEERIETVTPYPLAGALPSARDAINAWESRKRA